MRARRTAKDRCCLTGMFPGWGGDVEEGSKEKLKNMAPELACNREEAGCYVLGGKLVRRGDKKNRTSFITNCVLNLTRLNFSHSPSAFCWMQDSCRDAFPTAHSSV